MEKCQLVGVKRDSERKIWSAEYAVVMTGICSPSKGIERRRIFEKPVDTEKLRSRRRWNNLEWGRRSKRQRCHRDGDIETKPTIIMIQIIKKIRQACCSSTRYLSILRRKFVFVVSFRYWRGCQESTAPMIDLYKQTGVLPITSFSLYRAQADKIFLSIFLSVRFFPDLRRKSFGETFSYKMCLNWL